MEKELKILQKESPVTFYYYIRASKNINSPALIKLKFHHLNKIQSYIFKVCCFYK